MPQRKVAVELEMEVARYARGGAEADTVTRRVKSSIHDLGDEADATGRDLDQLALNADVAKRVIDDLGDEARGSAAELAMLDREIDKVNRSMVGQRLAAGRIGPSMLTAIPNIGGVPGPLIAGGVAATAALAPAIGGIIAAAVLGGVGTGGLIGGIALASQDARVKSAFKDLGHELLGGFEGAASPLVQPLVKAAHDIGDALGKEMPAFGKDFAVLSKAVDPVTHSVTGFVHELHPGLSSAFKASIPLARQFDKEMTGLGRASTIFLDDMADAAPGAKDALHDLFLITDQGVIAFGELTKELAGAYDLLHKIPLSDLAMETVPWFGIIGMVGQLRGKVEGTGDAMGDATGPADEFRKALEDQAKAAREDAQALDRVNKFVRDYFDLVTGRLDAAEHYQAAIDDLTESVAENGRTLDINTRQGRANRDALEEAAQATREMHDAGLLSDEGYRAQIASLERLAVKLGLSKDAVKGLIGALELTPRQIVIDAVVKLSGKFEKLAELMSLGGTVKQGPQQGRGGTDFSITPVVRAPDSRQFIEGTRDSGGPVGAGRSYLIGGQPEILTMGAQSGHVTPISNFGTPVVHVYIGGERIDERVDVRVQMAQGREGALAAGGVR